MSRKSYKTQYISVDRIPTKREVEWAKQRYAAGGPTDLVRRGFTLPGVEASTFGGHGALAHSLQTTEGREALSRGIARQAFREDPFAYMTEEQVRDHYTGLDDGLKTGLSEKQIASVAAEAWTRARLRQRERLGVLEDPFYVPGKNAPDFSANRQLEFGEPGLVGDVLGKPPKKGSGGESVGRAKKRQAEEAAGAVPKGKVKFGKGSKKDTRQDVLGGETDEEKPWRRDQADGSYVTRNGSNGSYQWFNKDGSLRGEAKDYKEIGANGRVFFGDLSTGEGRVTVGGDQRNETLVRNFKDVDGTASYDTYQMRNGREYKGASRMFTYGDKAELVGASHTITADYGNGNQVSMTRDSRFGQEPGEPLKPLPRNGGPIYSDITGPNGEVVGKLPEGNRIAEADYDVHMQNTRALLQRARGAVLPGNTKTDAQRQDYLLNQSGGVAKYLGEQRGVDLKDARSALDAAARRVGVGDGGQPAKDALKAAKKAYADQFAPAKAISDFARLATDDIELKNNRQQYMDKGAQAANERADKAIAEAIHALPREIDIAPRSLTAKDIKRRAGQTRTFGSTVVRPIERRRFQFQADNKGGSTKGDLFVDAADPAAQGPNTNTVRGRIEAAMGDAERLAYSRIQKRFQEKHGREMDVDVARIRALMETGVFDRTSARQTARELRMERDRSIAEQLASQAVADMPRDAQGYLVPESMDPGRRLGEVWLNESGTVRAPDSWEARQGRVQNVLSGGRHSAHNPGVADGSKLTAAQKLFLAHRYRLVPEVRRVFAFNTAPGVSGDYGTVERGATPVPVFKDGTFYRPGTGEVLRAGTSRLAKAQADMASAEGEVDSALGHRASLFGFLPGADTRVAKALKRAKYARIAPIAEANQEPATWWERTGKWYPRGRKGVKFDPNFRGIRAWGTNQGAKGGRTTR